MNHKPGEICWYHEEGEVFEVEILKIVADRKGTRFYLRATGNYKRKNRNFKHLKEDDIFDIWRGSSHSAEINCGWWLRDE